MKQGSFPLPEHLKPLFWDVDFLALDWEAERDFIVRRILQTGSWPAVRWLRSTLDDDVLRTWILAHHGGRLAPRQLRFWELVLDLPASEVADWIARAKDNPWERRLQQ